MTPDSDSPAPRAPRRRRRIGWLLGGVLIAAALGGGAWLLHPATLTRLLADQARQRWGIELHWAEHARYSLLPKLSLSFPATTARGADDTAALFSADRIEVTLPWSSLWRRPPTIERLLVERPQLDLDALERWLARHPSDSGPGGIPAFHLDIRDGSLRRHGALLARGIDVDLTHAGELDAWLAQWRSDGDAIDAIPPLTGRAGVRTIEIDGTRIEGLKLDVQTDRKPDGP